MTNLELAKEQGNQAAPNVIDAAKASEVQIDVTLAQEQGNQAAPLIADSLASSESYDAIKQQGNQAMPLIVDALAGSGSDTGFELLDFIEPDPEAPMHIPFYGSPEPGVYALGLYGILYNGHNLPNFTKLSVDNTEYDIQSSPEQEPSTAGCYLIMQQQIPIDGQERADEIKAVTGVDVKIGDTMVAMQFVLITEQALSGDVPFTLYADQDSWSGTLHEYIETSVEVYASFEPNSNSTAYELTVYTDNCSNPYVKIGDDGEWQAYDENNKPEIYLPGSYTFYLKAESNYDGSEVSNSLPVQIIANFDVPEVHIIEDPSAMFAGLNFRVHLTSNYSSSELTGRDDVVLLYKEQSAADWSSAPMTSTSNGYFAEVETGWGHKAIEYKAQINGVASDVPIYYEYNALPMTPSFVDTIDDQGTYYARLRFGANYPDMNTVETIEYSFDEETWTDAAHDAISGYELAEIHGYGQQTIYFRTKLVSDSSVKSATVEGSFSVLVPNQVVLNACTDVDGNIYDAVILGRQVWLGSNLRVMHDRNGNAISQNDYYAPATDDMRKEYGLLYNYDGFMSQDIFVNEETPVYGIAPAGWRLPTASDYSILSAHIQNFYETNLVGVALAAKSMWAQTSNTDAPGYDLQRNNVSEFAAYPIGAYISGNSYVDKNNCAYFATVNKFYSDGEAKKWYFYIQNSARDIIQTNTAFSENHMYSIRCIYNGTPEEFLASLAQQQSSSDNNS